VRAATTSQSLKLITTKFASGVIARLQRATISVPNIEKAIGSIHGRAVLSLIKKGKTMRKDKKLEQAIRECEAFLEECKAYQSRINESYTLIHGGKPEKYFDNASTERGILKHRALLVTRKLQDWRKNGKVE
jgi:hypothetical protein